MWDDKVLGGLGPCPLERRAVGVKRRRPNDDRVPQEERRPGPAGGTTTGSRRRIRLRKDAPGWRMIA